MDLKLAIVAAALSDDPREVPRLARRLGFAGVQYDAFGARLRIPDLSLSGRRDFRHMLATQDQELAGLRVDTGSKGLSSGTDVDRVIARLDSAMEATAALGTRLLCVDLGPLPQPQSIEPPKPRVTPEQAGLLILPEPVTIAPPPRPVTPASPADLAAMSTIDSALADLGRRADRYGVTLAFRSDLASFAAIERALKAAACPWFGLDIDPASVLRDEWTMDEIFSRFGDVVRHVRARDALGAHARTKPATIGQGSVNWEEFFTNLDAAAYRGWVTIDPIELTDRTSAAETGLAHLRPFMRK